MIFVMRREVNVLTKIERRKKRQNDRLEMQANKNLLQQKMDRSDRPQEKNRPQK